MTCLACLAGRIEHMLTSDNLRRAELDVNFHCGRLEGLLVAIDSHAKNQLVACSQRSLFRGDELVAVEVGPVHGARILDIDSLLYISR